MSVKYISSSYIHGCRIYPLLSQFGIQNCCRDITILTLKLAAGYIAFCVDLMNKCRVYIHFVHLATAAVQISLLNW